MEILPVAMYLKQPSTGVIQCGNSYVHSRFYESARKISFVTKVQRQGDTIIFETSSKDDTCKALDALYALLPLFCHEYVMRPKWFRRNFWIMWALVLAAFSILDTCLHYMNGDGFKVGCFPWDFFGIVVAMINYCMSRRLWEKPLEALRESWQKS